ncbi:MAG: hypothetical protein ACI9JN_000877 [Bacteroidia bacterium]
MFASFHGAEDTIYSIGMSNADTSSASIGIHRLRFSTRTLDGSFYESKLVKFMDAYACEIAGPRAAMKNRDGITIACQTRD